MEEVSLANSGTFNWAQMIIGLNSNYFQCSLDGEHTEKPLLLQFYYSFVIVYLLSYSLSFHFIVCLLLYYILHIVLLSI